MNIILDILFYITLGFFFYIYDIKSNNYQHCHDSIKLNINILLHHIISTSFLLFGCLSNNKYILISNLILFIIVLIQFNIIGGCVFTINAQKQCSGNYSFPMNSIHSKIVPNFIYPYYLASISILIIKLILLYKYNDPSILFKINIIIISFMILYFYSYKKKKDNFI